MCLKNLISTSAPGRLFFGNVVAIFYIKNLESDASVNLLYSRINIKNKSRVALINTLLLLLSEKHLKNSCP